MSVDKAGACFYRVLPGIEGAIAVVGFGIWFIIELVGRKIDGSAEGACTIGGGADASLDLYAVDGGSKVREVYKEDGLGFCIIVRDAIEGHIDAGGVRSAYAYTRIAYTVTCVGI